MGEVTRLGRINTPSLGNVLATLEEAKSLAVKHEHKRCMVLFLSENEKVGYGNGFLSAGFKNSEMISLLEITKLDVDHIMRGTYGGNP